MGCEIKINFSQAAQAVKEFERESNYITTLIGSVNLVKGNCGLSGNYRTSVVNSLNSIVRAMEKERASMKTMGNVLSTVIHTYESNEKALMDGAKMEKSTVNGGSSGAAASSGNNREHSGSENTEGNNGSTWAFGWSDFWKMISSGGIIGAGSAAIGNLITGKWGSGVEAIKTGLDSADFLLSVVGGGATVIDEGGGKTNWLKYLLGTDDAFGNLDVASVGRGAGMSATKTWSELFERSLGKGIVSDLKWDKTASTATKTNVITKWGSNLLALLSNGVENHEEYNKGEISVGRAWAETFIETGVDIAVGTAATAAVTATIGAVATALGVTVGAPAVVVGVASAGVVWAANGACKWITEKIGGEAKDIGEVVADVFCDTREWIDEKKRQAVKQIHKVGEAAVNAIGNACSSAGNWARGLLGFV